MSTLDPMELLAGLVDPVGRWGDCATAEQWGDAEAILSLDGPRRHWLGRAKGYSKTRDVAALSLVALLTQFPPGATGYAAASDADQASLLRQSIASFVVNTPELAGLVTGDTRRVSVKSGADIVILAADSAGSHGLRPYWLVVDELANWPDVPRHRDFFDSLWAGLPKVSDSRGIVITTAGGPQHFAYRILETAKLEPSWRVSDLHGPPAWSDPDEIAVERRRLFPSSFARLWLNEWCAPDDAIADPDDVAAACVLDGPLAHEPGHIYVAALDVGTRNDRTAVTIAHAERSPTGSLVTVDRLQVWTPRPGRPVSLDEVRTWLVEMCRSYRAKLLYDPSQAYLMIEQLRRSGVRTEEFTFTSSSVGKLATAIMQSLRGRLLRLPDDEDLRKELLSVRLRESSPNVLRIDHQSGGHDDRVISVAMAVYELTSGSPFIGADWLDFYKAQTERAAKAEPDQLRHLPRLGSREQASPRRGCQHRWQRWPDGESCVFCAGWRESRA